MSDAEFRMFCDLLKRHCGLHFAEDSRFLLERRLAQRVEALELGSFASYHFHLRRSSPDDGEMARVVDALTTNETYFFREQAQLAALVEELIPEFLERRSRLGSAQPVNIWSAGCASGEEPYSVVMLALDAGLQPGRDFRIYASDISGAALERARRGVYREASFRQMSAQHRQRYFSAEADRYPLREEVKKHVDFLQLNLLDRSRMALLGAMDVILCRNVIIYFDAETKQRVIASYYEKLRPGGYLLLGHSESLINLSNAFELRHLKRDIGYRRPIAGEETAEAWHEIAEGAARSAAPADGES